MVSFKITDLAFGWAEIDIILGANNHTFNFEFIPNNPLAELIKSAVDITLLKHLSTQICFYNGPKTRILLLNKQDENNCFITIQGVSSEVNIKQYVKAILRMFDQYLYLHTDDKGDAEWKQFISIGDVERLRHEYHHLP